MTVRQILVVDDDPVQRLITQKQLKILGLDALFACNGKEAVALASQHRLALILMDVQMPIMDGLEATVQIRAEGLATPIVACTAIPNRERCFDAGMTDYLFKPVMMDELKRILNEWAPEPATTA